MSGEAPVTSTIFHSWPHPHTEYCPNPNCPDRPEPIRNSSTGDES